MSVNQVKAGLVSALKADATLTALLADGTAGVYPMPAPQGAALPYITYNRVPGTGPAYTLDGKAWDNELYNVKAVTTGTSPLLAGSIGARIETVLSDNPVSVSGGSCLYLRLETYIEYPEVSDGKTYQHVGGAFRLWST